MAAIAGQDLKAAFLRIFAEYGPALDRLANAYTKRREDHEDLVQEIAAALWGALPAYRGEATERTWLYRIAHNVALTAMVKRRKRENREKSAPDPLPDFPAPGRTAEQNLMAEEKRGMLLAAVRSLPAIDRQITVLHLEGLSGAEIEAVTGIAEGAVATRLTRARERLRQAIRAPEMNHGR